MGNDDKYKEAYKIVTKDTCNDRGYHVVEVGKKKGKMSCYECEIVFDKGFAKKNSIEYRVIPRISKNKRD